MPRLSITGSFVAMITPFDSEGAIDYGALQDLIGFQAENGSSALLFMGSTGEVSMLSTEERHELIRRTVEMRPAGMPFFYGCSGPTTDAAVDMTRFAADNGADGAIITAPAYICASPDDLVDYFLTIADAVDLPLGIYNNPPRVQSDMHWNQLLQIFEHPNYVVHKESTTRVGQVAQMLAAKPDASIMCCDSPNLGLVLATMSLGGHGTANMTGNLAPRELATISTPWQNHDDVENFRETYVRILDLWHYVYAWTNPVALKSLMNAVGLPTGDLRRPLRMLEGPDLERGIRIVAELGLAEQYGWKATGR
ncbi:MAG: dihydrodipicolinate synthase family protein [Acidimicrobiia bacterium]|nr:dihydrodipicolinate synthase family protein [Acidimicrobiia bacterium]MDH4308833.1 dihydrodipicolinate synthase family protein [Acidimicrobiia bacterium]MDH5292729.1 dihydrodipicolinate synthase family protein [Acidimicrobiia bacterium]